MTGGKGKQGDQDEKKFLVTWSGFKLRSSGF